MRFLKLHILTCFVMLATASSAQVGKHRNELAFGVGGGYVLSQVGFTPKVPQEQLGGITLGATLRYTSEKYFSSICAIVAEANFVQTGWKERIQTLENLPVPNIQGDAYEAYSRKLTYLQVPLLARLGWGRERNGLQFFFQAGPQVGFFLSEKAEATFDTANPNMKERTSGIIAQYDMPVEHQFDYGITAGIGLEFSNSHLGHILLDVRYYYGLGDIYGNSKHDYFARSNLNTLSVKMIYLFDILRSKDTNIK